MYSKYQNIWRHEAKESQQTVNWIVLVLATPDIVLEYWLMLVSLTMKNYLPLPG